MAIETAIGRVVPSYEGDWSSSKSYKKLDNVLRNGSTYIAIQENINQTPEDHPDFWQLIAQRGEQGIQGEQGPQGKQGPQGEKGTKGDKGDTGSGSVSMVDGIGPGPAPDFDVPLHAIRYDAQNLTGNQKMIARANINAQIAGNYIISPATKTKDQFLKYNDNNTWVTADVFPSGGDTGFILTKTNSGTEWSKSGVILGGSAGAVLTKASATNYDLTWSNPISNPEIDTIMSD